MLSLDQIRDTHRPLADALAESTPEIELDRTALLIAQRHCPEAEVTDYLRRIDEYANRTRIRLRQAITPEGQIAAINEVLFDQEGFCGNAEEYYDPRNSLLNHVLDRKTGIPITLSILYTSVARRLGVPIVGIGFPMHFLVKYLAGSDLLIDPFNHGKILGPADVDELLLKVYGAPVALQESFIQPLPPRLILYRMLNNLKLVYLKNEDFAAAGTTVEQMLVVHTQMDDIRDRGLICIQERRWSDAAEYLTRYLTELPEASDAALVRTHLSEAFERKAQLN
jgi:regulator of sirC expression with transglutaminase-like and TPR domain